MMDNVVTLTLAEIWEKVPTDVPVFLDWHMYDIPETMMLAIGNVPDSVVAISFNITDMPVRWQKMVTEWCGERDIEVVWWKNPDVQR